MYIPIFVYGFISRWRKVVPFRFSSSIRKILVPSILDSTDTITQLNTFFNEPLDKKSVQWLYLPHHPHPKLNVPVHSVKFEAFSTISHQSTLIFKSCQALMLPIVLVTANANNL